jgi:glycosyltransferase involved in cell wall biosynthesis
MTGTVMLLGDTLNIGGSEGQFVEVATALTRSGWNVHAACVRAEGPLRAKVLAAGVDVWSCGPPSFKSPRLAGSVLKLARYCRRHEIALLHAFDFYSNILAVLTARLARIPRVIASQRELESLRPRHQRAVQRMTLRFATDIVANSTPAADDIRRASPRLRHRTVVVPNGVDTSRFSPTPRPTSAIVTIGTLANARAEKGLHVFIQAASMLSVRHPATRFRLWGDGPLRRHLEELAERLGIARQVEFCGRTTEPEHALRGLDVFVLPSLSEACPNAVLEAMATALPVVASDVGGIPDLVRHGETGYLVRPNSPRELASAIEALIDDRRSAKELGARGRARVVREFGMDRLIDRIDALYRGRPELALQVAAR